MHMGAHDCAKNDAESVRGGDLLKRPDSHPRLCFIQNDFSATHPHLRKVVEGFIVLLVGRAGRV
ncbi:hypothetical protein JYT82_00060 [bacterium AH-315-K20]|nr:hypothetical protein [bacterium AH-315-K20]